MLKAGWLVAALALAWCIPAGVLGDALNDAGIVVHVSVDGDDSGSGSAAEPFRTVSRAMRAADGERRMVIEVGPGEHGVGLLSMCSNVHLRGRSMADTVLVGRVVIRGVHDASIARLTLSGSTDEDPGAGRALEAVDGRSLLVEDVRIRGYVDGAVRLERWRGAVLRRCDISGVTFNTYRSTGTTPARQSTAVLIGDVEDVRIERCRIDTRERGGRGIGTTKESWSARAWADPPTRLKDLTIAHCTILVDQWHAWHVPNTSTHPPQMTIELWHAHSDNVVIHNCVLNNTVSLSCDPLGDEPLPAKTVRMHHNRFDLIPTGREYRYAVEPYVDRFEFDHNFVNRGIYPLATWNQHRAYDGWRIHHNVFYGTGNSQALINSASALPNLLFANNTVYLLDVQSRPLFAFGQGEGMNRGQRIVNNLFVSAVDQPVELGVQAGVTHNGFDGIQPAGSHWVRGRFLARRGELPFPYLALASTGDSAVGRGILIRGIAEPSERGRRIDLGALPHGSEPFRVGPSEGSE